MALEPGTRLGPYEVQALIGAGGMGEVYRAREAELGRDVAIKVLPSDVAHDPDRLSRFRREAQLLASLNHPNIAAIYGIAEDGAIRGLVLELVEGPSLEDRLRHGRLPITDALSIARQIADALTAAHDAGIIHRDLKPANIKLTRDGSVKVLDFGLAKATSHESDGLSSAPTITLAGTRAGVIMGSAPYMSPEQARGQPVDRRTDVWAFGCVLYELLAGKRAFPGNTVPDTIIAVLEREPDWTALPSNSPANVRRLLQRCLEKDLKHRFRDIGDAKLEIEDALGGKTGIATTASTSSRTGRRLVWILAALVVLAVITATALTTMVYRRVEATDARVIRFSMAMPGSGALALPSSLTVVANPPLAVSPDGHDVAFAARTPDGRTMLWVRPLDAVTARLLPGTEGASSPFWSPTGRFLAFFAGGKLKKIDVSGGLPVAICDVPDNRGGAWSATDVIVFSPGASITTRLASGLQKVPAAGGAPTAATPLAEGETSHVMPSFLPDGRHFLYRAVTRGATGAGPIYVGTLDSPDRKFLLNATSANVVYSRGHLLFVQDASLMAQPFDDQRLTLMGEAVPVVDQILATGTPPLGVFSVSNGGVLAFQSPYARPVSRLEWITRTGQPASVLSDWGDWGDVELSPDGKRAAATLVDTAFGTRDIWIFDLLRGLQTRLTSDPADDNTPIWDPQSARVIFDSNRKGPLELYEKATSGTSGEKLLLEDSRNKYPACFSPDGRYMLYMVDNGGSSGWDLWTLPLFGDQKPFPFLQTPNNEAQGRFSADGRWVAYVSNESGRYEVYITAFPGAGEKWQVSSGGSVTLGGWPRWRHDGKEIFYLTPDDTIMAASVTSRGDRLEVSTPHALFKVTRLVRRRWAYDVSPDGQRFLVTTAADDTPPPPVTVVVNWSAGLKR
jgi:Tol biopolymer transport system component